LALAEFGQPGLLKLQSYRRSSWLGARAKRLATSLAAAFEEVRIDIAFS
jgi:hypothetical protein